MTVLLSLFVRAAVLTMLSPCTIQRISLPNLASFHGPRTVLQAVGSPLHDNTNTHVPILIPRVLGPSILHLETCRSHERCVTAGLTVEDVVAVSPNN
jgi:hypothetical protein